MKKNDLILIGGILIIAFAILIGMHLMQKKDTSENAMVVITVDGEEINRLPLNVDDSLTITVEGQETNQLIIKDGKASITDATCPDKICVKHRAIKYDGESIVCLPHKLVVSIDGGEQSQVDTIAQ